MGISQLYVVRLEKVGLTRIPLVNDIDDLLHMKGIGRLKTLDKLQNRLKPIPLYTTQC